MKEIIPLYENKTTDFLSFCYVPSMDVEQEGQNVTFIRVINKINSGCDD